MNTTPPPPEARIHATTAANTAAILAGAHILRVHDVRPAAEAAAIADRILASRFAQSTVILCGEGKTKCLPSFSYFRSSPCSLSSFFCSASRLPRHKTRASPSFPTNSPAWTPAMRPWTPTSATRIVQMRTDIATEAQRTREASSADFVALRTEITGSIAILGTTLQNGLASFRADNKSSDDQLRAAVQQQLEALSQRLNAFTNETNERHTHLRESLNTKLADLMTSNTALQNQLREAVETAPQ